VGIYRNPMADDGPNPDALRETIRGNLTGLDLSEEGAWGPGNELDSIYLLAITLDDEAEIGRLFVKHAKAAADRIVDRRAS
jgi:hypothetical protein